MTMFVTDKKFPVISKLCAFVPVSNLGTLPAS